MACKRYGYAIQYENTSTISTVRRRAKSVAKKWMNVLPNAA